MKIATISIIKYTKSGLQLYTEYIWNKSTNKIFKVQTSLAKFRVYNLYNFYYFIVNIENLG